MYTDIHKTFTPLAACLVCGVLSPFLVKALGPGALATCVAVFGWGCFLAIAIFYPILSIKHGVIWSRTSITHRTEEPVRFYVGLATYETVILLFLLLATFALHAYLSGS